jgi:hypothetical protein
VGEDLTRGLPRTDKADTTDTTSDSGWVTTDVAARTIHVSPRTIRRYIDQGKLAAKPHGEGVRRGWLVSVDSLHTLHVTRPEGGERPRAERETEYADSIADVYKELAARLETRAEEAAELRVRLELAERTQSTLEDERQRAFDELADERRRREEAERERDELRHRLGAAASSEPPGGPKSTADEQQGRGPAPDTGPPQTPAETPEECRSWWRRFFGFV